MDRDGLLWKELCDILSTMSSEYQRMFLSKLRETLPWRGPMRPFTRYEELRRQIQRRFYVQTCLYRRKKHPGSLKAICLKKISPWLNSFSRKWTDILALELPATLTLELLTQRRLAAFYDDVHFSFEKAYLLLSPTRRAVFEERFCKFCKIPLFYKQQCRVCFVTIPPAIVDQRKPSS